MISIIFVILPIFFVHIISSLDENVNTVVQDYVKIVHLA